MGFRRNSIWAVLLCCLLANSCQQTQTEVNKPEIPQRIITMAPALTETVFALGYGEKLIARSRYCDFPVQALILPDVGGLFDPNYERILRLKPDLVLIYQEHEELKIKLAQFKIPSVTIVKETTEEISQSFIDVAEVLGDREAGLRMAHQFDSQLSILKESVDEVDKPRVLVLVGRNSDTDQINEVYAAGKATYFAELVRMSGGEYLETGMVDYPVLSAEALIRLNPEVIIEIMDHTANFEESSYLAAWNSLDKVEAVRTGKVYLIAEDYAVVPGPRLPQLLEYMIRCIHPEVLTQ